LAGKDQKRTLAKKEGASELLGFGAAFFSAMISPQRHTGSIAGESVFLPNRIPMAFLEDFSKGNRQNQVRISPFCYEEFRKKLIHKKGSKHANACSME
jgi:hypothetical protein